MTKAKKILALIISLMLVLGAIVVLGSCGGGGDTTQDSTPDSTVDSTKPDDTPSDDNQTEMVKVTFKMGEGNEDVVIEIEKGTSVGSYSIPSAPSIEGYKVEWENVSLKNLKKDVTVNLIKKPIDYRITYHLNDGNNDTSNPILYNIEDEIYLSDGSIEDGKFEGWYTDAEFKNPITKIEKGSMGEISLYARWSYSIKYEPAIMLNGNTNPKTYKTGEVVTFVPGPEIPDYDFAGWYLDSAHQLPITSTEGRKGTVTVYAFYEAKKYDIEYKLDGGNNHPDNPTQYTSMNEVVFKSPTKDGSVFEGWYEDEELTKKIEKIEIGSSGNKTIYASWRSLVELTDGKKDTGLNVSGPVSFGYADNTYLEKVTITTGTESALTKVIVRAYRDKALVFSSGVVDVNVSEIVIEIGKSINKLEVSPIEGTYIAEIESTVGEAKTVCDYKETNVAKESTISHDGEHFWAIDFTKLVDGNKQTGSASPKGYNYPIYLTFKEEYFFTSIALVCNGQGSIANIGETEGMVYNNPQITVKLYDQFDQLVYDSGAIDTSRMLELVVAPNVSAAKIEFIILGTGNRNGREFLYEVEAYAKSGDHVFDEVSKTAPTCNEKGKIEYNCPCGASYTEIYGEVVFHNWADGQTIKAPSATENGEIEFLCKHCGEAKIEKLPATNHNWDSGTIIAPTCTDGGYTVYKCTDSGCNLEYTNNYTYKTGHIFVDGVVTKQSTRLNFGELTYTCVNEGCNETKTELIRLATYKDSTFIITKDNVKEINSSINEDRKDAILDGSTTGNWWKAPSGGTLEIILDREYVLTNAEFYIWSNWNTVKIQLFKENVAFNPEYEEGEANPRWIEVCKFESGSFQNEDNSKPSVTFANELDGGKGVSRILLTSVSDKSSGALNNWSGIVYYEAVLTAHKCEYTEGDFIRDGSFIDATCSTDGSCKAYCGVCEQEATIVLDKETYGHKYGELVVETAPKCNAQGKGYYICSEENCRYKREVVIEKSTDHSFTEQTVLFAPTCEKMGVGRLMCSLCGAQGYEYPIPQTSVHVYEDKSECVYCGKEKE